MGVKDQIEAQELQGEIVFVQHHLPAMEAGDYELILTHDVVIKADPESPESGEPAGVHKPFTDSHHFAVYGERFALNPSEIDKVFPPPNTNGEYDNVLPHVVITRRTLPWERTPDSDGDPHIGEMTSTSDADVAPWLALLVLSETELSQCPQHFDPEDVAYRPATTTVAALFPSDYHVDDKRVTGTLPDNTLSYFSHPNSHNKLDDWETVDDPCNVLDIPVDLFNRIAPSLVDLPWLAHARTKQLPHEDETDYAMVVANRLPQQGPKTTVHLVSLERMSDYLPAEDGKGSPNIPQDKNYVRLISLMQWSFTAVVEKYSFKQVLEELNEHHQRSSLLRLPGTVHLREDAIEELKEHGLPQAFTDTLARILAAAGAQELFIEEDAFVAALKSALPPRLLDGDEGYLKQILDTLRSDSDEVVKQALEWGYTALNHTTRTAHEMVSWYRGPFTPYPVDISIGKAREDSIDLPAASADAIANYDDATDMFDVSYASAWQLGRLLALANKHFATEYYYWKRDLRQTTGALFAANQAGVPADPHELRTVLADVTVDALDQAELGEVTS